MCLLPVIQDSGTKIQVNLDIRSRSKHQTSMLYTFKSSSAADLIMQRFSAEMMLSIIGKTPGKKGVITVSEMDELIQKIEFEIKRQAQVEKGSGGSGVEISSQHDAVRFRESAANFLILLKTSKASGSNVVWGL
jgi:hypothetical protein